MAARALVAAMAITAWDVVMDPGMSRAGNWTWEQGGSYFGVPVQNYIGWVLTTLSVYLCSGVVLRVLAGQPETKRPRLYLALPGIAYGLVREFSNVMAPSQEKLVNENPSQPGNSQHKPFICLSRFAQCWSRNSF
jgi:hypothetical protein